MFFRQPIHKRAIKANYYLLSIIYYLLSGVATTVAAPKAPLTYSGDHIGPYPGFSWFVSRHYAILSDMEEKDVRDALDLLDVALQALCQRYAAGMDTDQADIFQSVIFFDDLMCDPLERPIDIVSRHQRSLIFHRLPRKFSHNSRQVSLS